MKYFARLLIAVSFFPMPSSLARAADAPQTIALYGSQAPGTATGTVFLNASVPTINDRGHVAFRAGLTGPDVQGSNNGGIWRTGFGTTDLLLRSGVGPGQPVFNSVNAPVINDNGQLAILVRDQFSDAIWSTRTGQLARVANDDSSISGVSYNTIRFRLGDESLVPHIASNGFVTFPARGINAHFAIRESSQGLNFAVPLRRLVDNLPGYELLGYGPELQINARGDIVAVGSLNGLNVNTSNAGFLFIQNATSLNLLARVGSPAPGSGRPFDAFHSFAVNDVGQVAFHGDLGGLPTGEDGGIWTNRNGAIEAIAYAGGPTPDGTRTLRGVSPPFLSEQGRIAFTEQFHFTLWSDAFANVAGDFQIVADASTPVPGLPDGTRFLGTAGVAMNGNGQLAFRARITGPGVTDSNDYGIWAQDRRGALRLIVREGDTVEVAQGDFRSITTLDFLTDIGRSGRQSFNALGQVVYSAELGGGPTGFGQAVFVSNRVADRLPQSAASSMFQEPVLGSANYAPAPTATEIGFTTTATATVGQSPLAAVALVEGQRVLSHRSMNATTTFDLVSLPAQHEALVSLRMRIGDTDFESGDFVRAYISNGAENVFLFNYSGTSATDDIDRIADGFARQFVAAVPPSWSSFRLVVQSSSNSSVGVERYDFSDVYVETIVAVPEPGSFILLAMGISCAFVRHSMRKAAAFRCKKCRNGH